MKNSFLLITLILIAYLGFNHKVNAQCKAQFVLKQINDSMVQVWDSSEVAHQYRAVFNFGDGDTSRTPEGKHMFPGPGRYRVCLTVIDLITDCRHDTCMPELVKGRFYNGVLADFTYYQVQHKVDFKDLSRAVGPIGHTSTWDFGDGTTSTETNTSHLYQNPGSYKVCLEVVDSMHYFASRWCETITIEDPSGINEKVTETYIQVYPNPARENLIIKTRYISEKPVYLFVCDLTGRKLIAKELINKTGELNLDVSQLKQGMYQVNLINEGHILHTAFLKN